MTRRCVRALRRERVAWVDALAATLEASLAALAAALEASLAVLTAPRERAIAGLHEAAGQLEAAGLGGFADAVRWRLQHVLGHGAGSPWQHAAVVRPDRLAHTLAPLPVYRADCAG